MTGICQAAGRRIDLAIEAWQRRLQTLLRRRATHAVNPAVENLEERVLLSAGIMADLLAMGAANLHANSHLSRDTTVEIIGATSDVKDGPVSQRTTPNFKGRDVADEIPAFASQNVGGRETSGGSAGSDSRGTAMLLVLPSVKVDSAAEQSADGQRTDHAAKPAASPAPDPPSNQVSAGTDNGQGNATTANTSGNRGTVGDGSPAVPVSGKPSLPTGSGTGRPRPPREPDRGSTAPQESSPSDQATSQDQTNPPPALDTGAESIPQAPESKSSTNATSGNQPAAGPDLLKGLNGQVRTAIGGRVLPVSTPNDSELDEMFVQTSDQDQTLFPDAMPDVDETVFLDGLPSADEMPAPGEPPEGMGEALVSDHIAELDIAPARERVVKGAVQLSDQDLAKLVIDPHAKVTVLRLPDSSVDGKSQRAIEDTMPAVVGGPVDLNAHFRRGARRYQVSQTEGLSRTQASRINRQESVNAEIQEENDGISIKAQLMVGITSAMAALQFMPTRWRVEVAAGRRFYHELRRGLRDWVGI
jgi:hypothetical protein